MLRYFTRFKCENSLPSQDLSSGHHRCLYHLYEFHINPPSSCWDISVRNKVVNQPTIWPSHNFKSGVVQIPAPVSEKGLHHCLKVNILTWTQVYAPIQYFMEIANYHTSQATCVTSCTFYITCIGALPGISSYTKFRYWNRYGKEKHLSAHLYLSLQLINVVQHEHSSTWKDLETQNVTYSCVSVLCPLPSSIQTSSPPCTSPKRFPNL